MTRISLPFLDIPTTCMGVTDKRISLGRSRQEQEALGPLQTTMEHWRNALKAPLDRGGMGLLWALPHGSENSKIVKVGNRPPVTLTARSFS